MKKWLVMDVFHQVHGPYTKAEVKALLRRGNKFFVATPSFDRWVPVDFIPEFTYIPASDDANGKLCGSQLDANSHRSRLSELVGICKGVIADGIVVPEEAVFLRDWLAKNQGLLDCWPADVISQRLEQVFADGKVDAQEQADLLVLLTKISSEQPTVNEAGATATPLPLTMPEPLVVLPDKRFCLSGKFVYGPHARCKEAIVRRGGKVDVMPGAHTDYVVIGGLSLADWRESPDAKKVHRAEELRQVRPSLRIVSEENLAVALSAQ